MSARAAAKKKADRRRSDGYFTMSKRQKEIYRHRETHGGTGLPADYGGKDGTEAKAFAKASKWQKSKKPKSTSEKNTTKPGKTLRYPQAAIHRDTDYLEIQILEYVASGFTPQKSVLKEGLQRASSKSKNIIQTIYLPIPQNIQDKNATSWGEDRLNAFAAMGASAAAGIIKDQDFIKGMGNALATTGGDLKTLATTGAGQQLVTAWATGAAANLLGGQTNALARSTGQIMNPNVELLFDNIKLRSFMFEFDLAPRDRYEGLEIKRIIRQLKSNMAPTTSDLHNESGGKFTKGLFLKSPNIFQLKYKKGSRPHPFLNLFKKMALVDIGVNYTGSGTYMTYADGTPVHTKLSLAFQELDPVYREDYNDVMDNDKAPVGY